MYTESLIVTPCLVFFLGAHCCFQVALQSWLDQDRLSNRMAAARLYSANRDAARPQPARGYFRPARQLEPQRARNRFQPPKERHAQNGREAENRQDARNSREVRDRLEAQNRVEAQNSRGAQNRLQAHNRVKAQNSREARNSREPRNRLEAQIRVESALFADAAAGATLNQSIKGPHKATHGQGEASCENDDGCSPQRLLRMDVRVTLHCGLGSSGPNLEPGTMRIYVTNGSRNRLGHW